jgi:hypothetical protein
MLFYAENIEIHYLGLIDLDGHGAKKKRERKNTQAKPPFGWSIPLIVTVF